MLAICIATLFTSCTKEIDLAQEINYKKFTIEKCEASGINLLPYLTDERMVSDDRKFTISFNHESDGLLIKKDDMDAHPVAIQTQIIAPNSISMETGSIKTYLMTLSSDPSRPNNFIESNWPERLKKSWVYANWFDGNYSTQNIICYTSRILSGNYTVSKNGTIIIMKNDLVTLWLEPITK